LRLLGQAPTPLETRGLTAFQGSLNVDDEIWMTAQQAADHCGVKPFTIYSWERRGHLKVGGLDEHGHKLFRLLDVADAELTTRARARKRVLTSAA
jgi:hypothetical protein